MIQVRRPNNGPAVLKRLGEKQTRLDCAAYDVCPGDYQSGKESFSKRSYYNKEEVKRLLVSIHHSKCCYCEQRFRTLAYLHVEHFRPKAGVRQTRGQRNNELPGYYWLAYSWQNLLLSCYDCNCQFKRTLFPLANPADRARSHHDDITREHPFFVDPAAEDPRNHIVFDGDLPIGLTEKGRMTIEGLGLRRNQLREERLELLELIDTYYEILQLPDESPISAQLRATARQRIDAATRPDAKFSSMAIDYVACRGL
jgi:uncharacterized protein (TIGR02646 family)